MSSSAQGWRVSSNLQMMFAVPSEPYQLDRDFVESLNTLLIVHADHEQNCSTSTVRMVTGKPCMASTAAR